MIKAVIKSYEKYVEVIFNDVFVNNDISKRVFYRESVNDICYLNRPDILDKIRVNFVNGDYFEGHFTNVGEIHKKDGTIITTLTDNNDLYTHLLDIKNGN